MAKLGQILKRYKGDLARVHKESCLEMSSIIQEKTPVDTGDAKRRWSHEGVFSVGSTYSFLNNIEYIIPLEHGHSDQRPEGMVKSSLPLWPGIVRSHL